MNNETMINIEDIKILANTRTDIAADDLSNLMMSIKESGLINPITAWKSNGEYIVACGHRRLLAMKKLGRKSLFAGTELKILPNELNEQDFMILNLAENIHRVENSPLELAKGCFRLKELGLNISEISIRLGLPRGRIETAMRLLSKVPKEHKQDIGYIHNHKKNGAISATVASNITGLRVKQKTINELFKLAKQEELTVGDIQLYGSLLQQGHTLSSAKKAIKEYVIVRLNPVLNVKEFAKLKEDNKGKTNALMNDIIAVYKGEKEPNPNLFC